MNPSPNLEPPAGPRPAGNYSATCDGYLPETTRATPRDQHADLARLDERLIAARGEATAASWEQLVADLARARHLLEIIRTEAEAMPAIGPDVECGFEGPVDADVQSLGGGAATIYWTCPRCGTEHADEREAGDDA